MELSPLRSLDDFLLGSARFQLPNYKDLEKWGNRVTQNLLYYQTNYFLMGVILFLIVSVLHPLQMFLGAFGLIVMYSVFCFCSNARRCAVEFQKDYPIISVIVLSLWSLFFVYLIGSLLVFLFGVLLPICVTFIHASLRLRNIKNKLASIERLAWKETPMGVFLEFLGMKPEFI